MSSTDRADIWFTVVNSFAASKKAGILWESAEKLLKERGVAFHGTRTGNAGNAAELSFDACMAGYRRFIAAGGDGTVHDVLNGIAAFVEWCAEYGRDVDFNDFTLGVIPLGSGNDWMRSHGLGKTVVEAVDMIAKGNTMLQDVVKVSLLNPDTLPYEREISVSYMINVGGVGIDARVCERVNALKRRGKGGKLIYVSSLLKVLSKRVPAYAKVMCDGVQVFDGPYLSIAFGLGRYSGGGMRQTPLAEFDDGLLDMTLIPDIALHRIVCEAPRLFTGSFHKVPELTVCKGKVITILPYGDNAPEPVEVDGEVVGKSPVRLEVMAARINVMTGQRQ